MFVMRSLDWFVTAAILFVADTVDGGEEEFSERIEQHKLLNLLRKTA